MYKIWINIELCWKFKDLLKTGKSGIIASPIAASQRIHTYKVDQICVILHDFFISTLVFYVFGIRNILPNCVVFSPTNQCKYNFTDE